MNQIPMNQNAGATGVTDQRAQYLAEAVTAMHYTFSDHVACQESGRGFLEFMAAAAPRYRDLLEHLREEHKQLSRRLASLRVAIHRAGSSDCARLFTEAGEVAAAIAEHHSLEREILRDGFEAPHVSRECAASASASR